MAKKMKQPRKSTKVARKALKKNTGLLGGAFRSIRRRTNIQKMVDGSQ